MIEHSEDFKQDAVRIALTSGLPHTRFASDLGVVKSTLDQRIWWAHHRQIWPMTYRACPLSKHAKSVLVLEALAGSG